MRYIIHCLSRNQFKKIAGCEYYKPLSLVKEGYIHCSDIDTFKNVAVHFDDGEYVLCVIDTLSLESPLVYEDLGNYKTAYPHIYGPLNCNSIIVSLPFLRDEEGIWQRNPELDLLAPLLVDTE